MRRFLIFDPTSNTYVKAYAGGWTSGHNAAEVNSFSSFEEAREFVCMYDSLSQCDIVEVQKTVEVVQGRCL